jgi:predicted permease
MLQSLVQDLRYAARTLRGSPGFSVVAVLMLTLGIGANTAIFSVVSAVLLKPLPFEEPARLVTLWEDFSARSGPGQVEPTPATYVEWRARAQSYEGMALLDSRNYNLTGNGEPERLVGLRTETNLFSLLGLPATLGRTFVADDEGAGAPPVAVISEGLWASRFAADPNVVGRTIELDGLARTIVGVVPAAFRFPQSDVSVWLPAQYSPEELAVQTSYNYYVVARLKPGVTLAAAQAELDAITQAVAVDLPTGGGRTGAAVASLSDRLTRQTRPTLYTLLAAVGIVLLITCANVANLLLARGTARRKEIAVRKAIGAGTGRVLRQLLTESALLAAGGVALGVASSALSFRYLTALVPSTFPVGAAPTLDWRVLAFTMGVAALTVLLFGVAPALAGARQDVNEALKKGGGARASSDGRLRHVLVVAEIALTVMLLAAGGLLLRSYTAVLAVDPGFPADRLLVADTPLAPAKYAAPERRDAFYRSVLERVTGLPGVTSAGYVNAPPLIFKGGRSLIGVEGQPPPTPETFNRYIVANRTASNGYLETLGVPLLQGRLLDRRDDADAARAVVVNEAMAQRFWPDTSPLGQRITLGPPGADTPWYTVVGVVGNVSQMGLDVAPEPEFTLSASQLGPTPYNFYWPRFLLVRTAGEPLALASALRSAVWDVDADQPVTNLRTMNAVLNGELATRNLQLTLVGGFALLALALAAIGLYGVLAYGVAQRGGEIALRMALGAGTRVVVGGIMRSALALTGIGLTLGLVGALASAELVARFLFGVPPTDPLTLAAVAALLVAVTLIASFLPARRAAGVAPAAALRSE